MHFVHIFLDTTSFSPFLCRIFQIKTLKSRTTSSSSFGGKEFEQAYVEKKKSTYKVINILISFSDTPWMRKKVSVSVQNREICPEKSSEKIT